MTRVEDWKGAAGLIHDLEQVTCQEMMAWRRKLTCISDRLQREMGARRHRHQADSNRSDVESQTAFDVIGKTIQATFEAQSVTLWVMDYRGNDLVAHSVMGSYAVAKLLGLRQGAGIGSVGWVVGHRKALLLTASIPPSSHADYEIMTHRHREAMIAPITIGEHLIGVLDVGPRPSGQVYSVEDLQTLNFMLEVDVTCCYLAVQSNRAEAMMSTSRLLRAA